MSQALVFNLQKFCVHDGPGIRTTVFFKGCPLRCSWCHNPESQKNEPEMLCDRTRCSGCGVCRTVCPNGAIELRGGEMRSVSGRCKACGRCSEDCLSGARQLAGRRYTLTDLVKLVERDRPFYEESGGGVTLSGGEALSQGEAAAALAEELSRRGIHVALDTCGHCPPETLRKLLPWTDLFLYDLKHMDAQLHRRYTGQDNALILQNLRLLLESGAKVALRLPLLAGMNDDEKNIGAVLAFIAGHAVERVHLLPYHTWGRDKWNRIPDECRSEKLCFAPPDQARLEEIAQRFRQAHYEVRIGG